MNIFKVLDDAALIERAWRVAAKNYRHLDYKRTVDIRRWCFQVNTGNDQKEILIKYKVKETEKQQEQRVRVTNSRTPQVANKTKAMYNEVHRTDDVIDNIVYDGKKDASKGKIETLNTYIENYRGQESAREYLTRKNSFYTFYDPNAWHVVEFAGDGADRVIMPFEVSCVDALDFEEKNGVLQYLVSRITRNFKKKDGDGHISNNKYTLYAAGFNFDIIEVPEDVSKIENWIEPEGYEIATKTTEGKTEKRFYFKAYETKNKWCPAKRFGFIQNPESALETNMSPLHLAEKTIQRLIWRTSTHDVSHACHGFYKMMMYTERCNHQANVNGAVHSCDRGYVANQECKKCKGTGKKMHLSEQDVVMYLLDHSNAEKPVQPLSNYIHYATIPTELIKEQKEEVREAINDTLSTVFNEQIFEKGLVTKTATEIQADWRGVNNRLMDYGDFDTAMYKFTVKTIAMIQNIDEGLNVQYGYPSDFKLESVQELLQHRATAVTANSPAEVIFSLDVKILSKQHLDDPQYVANFRAKEMFRPLRTKSRDERMVIITGLPQLHPFKILDQYFDEIFDMIFSLQPNFSRAPYPAQRALLDKEVEKWIEQEKEWREANAIQFGQAAGAAEVAADDDEEEEN